MTTHLRRRLTSARRRPRKTGVDFGHLCIAVGIPRPVSEYQFALAVNRLFRFDYAWPAVMLALEVEGGALRHGGHQRVEGFLRDLEKYNLAVLLGWRVLRCLPVDISDGSALELLHRAFGRVAP